MKVKKYKHMSFEDRCVIEEFLNNKYTFILYLTPNQVQILKYFCIYNIFSISEKLSYKIKK